MSQTFDITKPISGTTKFSELYQIIRDHDQANQSNFSGTSAPASPVIGQNFYNTTTGLLYVYTSASGWSEVAQAGGGIGQEIVTARGSHASLDSRLDAQLNEDGTLKASTSLNPSQWYDLTVASGYISTTSFKALGADYTTVYYATRRLKVNRGAGTYYTEVVSSSYSAPDTTVVTRDAVVSTDLVSVSHSIVGPRKASAGDGAVSYEMVANKNIASPTTTYTVLQGDSIVLGNPDSAAFTITGLTAATFGAGRSLFVANIGAGSNNLTYDPAGTETVDGSSSNITLAAGQSLHIVSDGSNWKRLDQPVDAATYTTPTSSSGWTGANVGYSKDPFGYVHLKGAAVHSSSSGIAIFTLPAGYRPSNNVLSLSGSLSSSWLLLYVQTDGKVGPLESTYELDYAFFDGITFKAA